MADLIAVGTDQNNVAFCKSVETALTRIMWPLGVTIILTLELVKSKTSTSSPDIQTPI